MTEPSPALTDEDQALREALLRQINALPPDQRAIAERIAEIVEPIAARATAAEKKQAEDRAWYEITVSVVEEQRDDYRARMKAAEARATAAEAERDRLRSDLTAAVVKVGIQAQARGEAEGRLRASEMAGVVEGWRERAEAAEAALREKDREIERLLHFVDYVRMWRDRGPPHGDPVTAWGAVAHHPVVTARDRALAPTDPLPARDEASR